MPATTNTTITYMKRTAIPHHTPITSIHDSVNWCEEATANNASTPPDQGESSCNLRDVIHVHSDYEKNSNNSVDLCDVLERASELTLAPLPLMPDNLDETNIAISSRIRKRRKIRIDPRFPEILDIGSTYYISPSLFEPKASAISPDNIVVSPNSPEPTTTQHLGERFAALLPPMPMTLRSSAVDGEARSSSDVGSDLQEMPPPPVLPAKQLKFRRVDVPPIIY